MKLFYLLALMSVMISCNNKKDQVIQEINTPDPKTEVDKNPAFFPVTNFIKGQIMDIRTRGINPLRIIKQNGREDSMWIKIENLEQEMKEFMTPDIDTSNLRDLFKETNFLDQTMNAVTLTYDPKTILPDSLTIKQWTVYVDPLKNRVMRIYMAKQKGAEKLHLTWESNEWCRIVVVSNNDQVQKEVLIKWDF
jgi:hypothetical protein